MKVAILSNVNVDSIIKEVGKTYAILSSEGYGNVLEALLNKHSKYNLYKPNLTFLIMDVYELIKSGNTLEDYYKSIDHWFNSLEQALETQSTYFISDGECKGYEFFIGDKKEERALIEAYWNEGIRKLCTMPQVFKLPYKECIRDMGAQAFYTSKLWYLGKIPYTNKAQKALAQLIEEHIDLYQKSPKKVLVLDLDNTLWGGVIGEEGFKNIQLSEDGLGAIYKDFQRVLKTIKEQGVLLAIVSKNNEEDALEVLREHPHMVLLENDFIIKKINWQPKHMNIEEIAKALNVGLDALVFIDDHPVERESIKALLPEVIVPEFPSQIEALSQFGVAVYETYFKQLTLTKEDKEKTVQYKAKLKRDALEKETISFESFLQNLSIEVRMYQNHKEHLDRIHQLLIKTNQFNLTTKRYDRMEVEKMLENPEMDVFTFEVKDKFGDNGIVSVVMIDKTKEIPVIDTFIMSCRVMGKWIEHYIIDVVENTLYKQGARILKAYYIPTAKNVPVKTFYKDLGYTEITEGCYTLDLEHKQVRTYFIKAGE